MRKLVDRVFDAFDTSGDGKIDVAEMHRFLNEVDVKITKEDITNIITLFDENNDGNLDKPEFLHFMYVALNSNPDNIPGMLFYAADVD